VGASAASNANPKRLVFMPAILGSVFYASYKSF